MRFTFTIEVEVSRESGKFASRDEIAQAIQEELESIDPDLQSVGADGDSVYNVDTWEVSHA